MRYAVVDISSTSISLLVAEGEGRVLDVVLKERENLSMLHYLEERELSGRGLEKLTDALMRVRTTLKNLEVDRAWLISTAAMRGIRNFDEVSAAVAARTGMTVNLIDGNTEAYCDYVSNQRYAGYDRALLLDVGGGSVEVCDFSKPAKEEMICLNFGLMGLSKRFVKGIHPTDEEAGRIKKYVLRQADESGLPKKGVFKNAVLVGSILNAVYAVYADYFGVKGEEKRIEYKKLKALTGHLMDSSERSMLILKNAPEKLYVLVTACVVLKTLLKRFDVTNILVSDLGVKEGYLQLVLGGEEQGIPVDLGELPELPFVRQAERIRIKKAKAGGKGKSGEKAGKAKKSGRDSSAAKGGKKPPHEASKPGTGVNAGIDLPIGGKNPPQPEKSSVAADRAEKAEAFAGNKPESLTEAEEKKAESSAGIKAGTPPEGERKQPADQPKAARGRGRPKGSRNKPKAPQPEKSSAAADRAEKAEAFAEDQAERLAEAEGKKAESSAGIKAGTPAGGERKQSAEQPKAARGRGRPKGSRNKPKAPQSEKSSAAADRAEKAEAFAEDQAETPSGEGEGKSKKPAGTGKRTGGRRAAGRALQKQEAAGDIGLTEEEE